MRHGWSSNHVAGNTQKRAGFARISTFLFYSVQGARPCALRFLRLFPSDQFQSQGAVLACVSGVVEPSKEGSFNETENHND